jgi:hypothetical protein
MKGSRELTTQQTRQTNLQIVASPTSAPGDFDFLVGKWKVHNRKLKTRLNNCTDWIEFEAFAECKKILEGFGNTDSFKTSFPGAPAEAMTLRLFNPKTRLWSIYWADSNVVVLDVPVIGSFDGDKGKFYARDVFEGKDIVIQFVWDKSHADSPVWSQAFSADDGKTWEWNWYMNFSRES